MSDDLTRRLADVADADDVDALLDLGCDLADAGRQLEAENCFRRAAALGSSVALFNLGNTLRDLDRPLEAVAAYEAATAGGEADAWLNFGLVLVERGDIAGGMSAYRAAAAAGDSNGALLLAFELRAQGEHQLAEQAACQAAEAGNMEAKGVLACWRWCTTRDPALEPDLRAGAEHFPSARADLADLLSTTQRVAEARQILQRGAKLGEAESLLKLGNLYADVFGDADAAEDAYRAGIAVGDNHGHANLGVLLFRRGDLAGAKYHCQLGAQAGDELAARHLRNLESEDGSGD